MKYVAYILLIALAMLQTSFIFVEQEESNDQLASNALRTPRPPAITGATDFQSTATAVPPIPTNTATPPIPTSTAMPPIPTSTAVPPIPTATALPIAIANSIVPPADPNVIQMVAEEAKLAPSVSSSMDAKIAQQDAAISDQVVFGEEDWESELEALDKEPIDENSQPKKLEFSPPASPWPRDQLRTVHLRELIFQSLHSDAAVRTLSSGVSISSTTAFEPHITQQQERVELGAFDPNMSAKFERTRIDEPPSSFFGPGFTTQNERNETEFSARLEKLWGTGTKTAIAYEPSLAYLFFPQGVSSGFNPLHSSDLLFEVTQPLLKGNGRRSTMAPIRIARHRTRQSHLELEDVFQDQLRSIEQAYWKLHAAHVQLQAVDQILPLAQTVAAIEEHRLSAERVTEAEVARAAVVVEEFRRQRASAILNVKRRNFQLSQLLGFSWNGSAPLLPLDQPATLPPTKDVAKLASVALGRRPDLRIRRLEVAVKLDELALAENKTLPELDLRSYYRAAGLSDSLNRSLGQLSEFRYEDWGYGISFSMPLGRNASRGELHSAKFAVVREQVQLASYEKQVSFEIAELVATAQADYDRFQSALRQLSHTQRWLQISRTRYEQPRLNRDKEPLLLLLADYQRAMQAHVDGITEVAETLADYNSDLAEIEKAQGTTFQRWGIQWYGCEAEDQPVQLTTKTQFSHSQVPSE